MTRSCCDRPKRFTIHHAPAVGTVGFFDLVGHLSLLPLCPSPPPAPPALLLITHAAQHVRVTSNYCRPIGIGCSIFLFLFLVPGGGGNPEVRRLPQTLAVAPASTT